ncbi:pentapeptide repeat-containing protein [Spirillospora sp. NBC_00431]
MKKAQRRVEYGLARPAVRSAGVVLAGLGLLALAAGYAVALWKMPGWMGLEGKGGDARDRHNARLLVVSAGGAVVVAISLLYTARSYRLSHRGQVTDRFTKALERLSSPDIDARLGGIHALAHVAADSRHHHDDVVEVLEAFLRRRAPRARPSQDGPTLSRRPPLPTRPDSDVQAALTALGRRPNRPERRKLNLSRLHLGNARLSDLDLSNMILGHVNLVAADLEEAILRSVLLTRADLQGVTLEGADLRHAFLMETDLRHAVLEGADLRGAVLVNADLRGASLMADLRGALLGGADLRGADLRGVIGRSEQDIRSVAKVDEHTRFGVRGGAGGDPYEAARGPDQWAESPQGR